ncbi:hypothetical protein PIB30_096927 [Stylosanthes scabra]|uniref:Uncharacterized protein n=1 Tax=Stylosanthes scabra TaxID=79078 RepID=A0ABU6ZUX8_9FABA|nr:hypothetical protein [Stylosanthes scabra]
MVTRKLSTIFRSTFPPGSRVDGDTPHEPDLDFFSIELALIILQGEGSGAGTAPQASDAGPSFNRFCPPNEMYDVFSCGEQAMDHIAHEYRASCATEDAVYRPSPPLQPHHDPEEQCQGFHRTTSPPRNRPISHLSRLTAVPAPVHLSHPVAAATVLCERVIDLTPPGAR